MARDIRSEEHTSELQSPIDISYAVFCLKKKNKRLADAVPGRPAGGARRRARGCGDDGARRGLPGGCRRGRVDGLFFKGAPTPETYTSIDTLSLHDALPI